MLASSIGEYLNYLFFFGKQNPIASDELFF